MNVGGVVVVGAVAAAFFFFFPLLPLLSNGGRGRCGLNGRPCSQVSPRAIVRVLVRSF